jgi:hypothetical protein
MSYSGPITIHSADGWTLDSYGNGAAYTLSLVANGESRSCFFQGDDAATFRDEFEAACEHDRVAEMFGDYTPIMTADEP